MEGQASERSHQGRGARREDAGPWQQAYRRVAKAPEAQRQAPRGWKARGRADETERRGRRKGKGAAVSQVQREQGMGCEHLLSGRREGELRMFRR